MGPSRKGPGGESGFHGFLAGVGAFAAWGLLPIYWKQLQTVPPLEILSHRILWSLLFVGTVIVMSPRGGQHSARLVREPRKLGLLALSGVFLGCNWLIFIAAINSGKVLDTSLGYFITPLVNVLFGFLFFHDRLGRLQTLALVLAVAGVGYQVVLLGRLPLVSLGLALSFGTYGLLRKWVHVDVLSGLLVETLVLALPALAYLLYRGRMGIGAFGNGTGLRDCFLAGTGVATSLPLLAFAFGARRMSLVSLGFIQFISPTITFFLGLFLFHEPLERARLVTFVLIWIAVCLYSVESLMSVQRNRKKPVVPGLQD